MGIDPVTHELLTDQNEKCSTTPQDQKPCRAASQKPSCAASQEIIAAEDQKVNVMLGTTSINVDNSNVSIRTENSSTDESQPLDPKTYDDPLMSYLLSDNFLEDSSWNFPASTADNFSDFGVSSSGESSAWLLSSNDLGGDGETWAWFLE